MQRRVLIVLAERHQPAILLLEADAAGTIHPQGPLRPLHEHSRLPAASTVTPAGISMSFLADSRHKLILDSVYPSAVGRIRVPLCEIGAATRYVAEHLPPTPTFRAFLPVITPRGVVRILIPKPAQHRGNLLAGDVNAAAGL